MPAIESVLVDRKDLPSAGAGNGGQAIVFLWPANADDEKRSSAPLRAEVGSEQFHLDAPVLFAPIAGLVVGDGLAFP